MICLHRKILFMDECEQYFFIHDNQMLPDNGLF